MKIAWILLFVVVADSSAQGPPGPPSGGQGYGRMGFGRPEPVGVVFIE